MTHTVFKLLFVSDVLSPLLLMGIQTETVDIKKINYLNITLKNNGGIASRSYIL